MKKLNLLRAALLALHLGVVAVSDSYGQENSGSQEQTEKTTNLVFTVEDFIYQYWPRLHDTITITDVSDRNIKEVGDVIRRTATLTINKISLILQSPNKELTKIGDEAFSGCSNLTSITIPEGVTEIG